MSTLWIFNNQKSIFVFPAEIKHFYFHYSSTSPNKSMPFWWANLLKVFFFAF